MKNIYAYLLVLLFQTSYAQPLVKQWDFSYGGYDNDFISQIIATSDGGFTVGGYSHSNISYEKSEDNFDATQVTSDLWLIHCDANGLKLWDKTLGGTNNDFFYRMISTPDGGILVMGSTNSPLSGNISHPPIGNYDMYIVKLSSTGTIEWDKRFGGISNNSASDAIALPDGGYLVAGTTNSPQGFDVTDPPYGNADVWIVRLDSLGNKLWDKRYGGTDDDSAIRILEKPGGFLLVNGSISNAGGVKSQNNYVNGKTDLWCIAIDSSGNMLWDKILGSLEDDYSIDAKYTPDHNYLFSAITYANAGADKSENTYGVDDFWVVKTDTSLTKIWDHSVGGDSNEDDGGKISLTADGNYLITGTSYSLPGFWKSQTNNGPENTWTVLIDANGNKVWDKTVLTGYSHTEAGMSVQLADGCFVMCNDGDGFQGNDKTDFSYNFDFWCVKYCDTTATPQVICNFTVNAGNDTVLCTSNPVTLNGSSSLLPAEIDQIYWSPGNLLNDSTILNPVATVSGTTQFILTVNAFSNLIFNGDFSLGDTGFTSNYIPGQGGISGIVSDPGEYDINVNPHNSHIDFATFGDHTTGTGNMMIINGSDSFNDTLWCQQVSVTPASNYIFSAWFSTANWQNPAIMQAYVNGIPLGASLYLSTDTGTWHELTYPWNSGTNTTAEVCIADLSTWSAGNDFVMDDISFSGVCTITDTVLITVQSQGTISLGNDTTLCQGQSFTLSAPVGFSNYQWALNNSPLPDTSSSINISQPGQYSVLATSAGGCTASDTVTVVFNNSIVVSLGADTSFCSGDSILLNAPAGFSQYNWTLNGSTVNNATASIYASQQGVYTVTVISASGCSGADSVSVTVHPLPNIQTLADTSLCSGNSLQLFAAGGTSYDWSPGTYLNDSTVQAPVSTPLNSILYFVTGTDVNGCMNRDSVAIDIATAPQAAFTYAATISCEGFLIATENLSNNNSQSLWNFGDGTVSTEQNPVHLYPKSGNYQITLVVSSLGCTDTAATLLSLQLSLNTDSVTNVFSPNGDGLNDCFYPLQNDDFAACSSIKIFTRWGEEIYTSHEGALCWNGKSDNTGEDAVEGIYFYIISVLNSTLKGTVKLERE